MNNQYMIDRLLEVQKEIQAIIRMPQKDEIDFNIIDLVDAWHALKRAIMLLKQVQQGDKK